MLLVATGFIVSMLRMPLVRQETNAKAVVAGLTTFVKTKMALLATTTWVAHRPAV